MNGSVRNFSSMFLGGVCRAMAAISVCMALSCDSTRRTSQSDLDAASKRQTEAIKSYGESRAVRDTIGWYSRIEGLRKLPVRGYGLVVGLGENGSRTCPERIRKRVATEIRKKYRLGDSRVGRGMITPEQMINSGDTAVVFVHGEIGAGVLAGTSFDLQVEALPNTETTSLRGGRLYTCDLFYFRPVGGGVVQEGKVVAKGEGPLFVNPFARQAESASTPNLRSAKIIGGGTSLEDRLVRLVLSTPSYVMATNIRDRINNRFGRGVKIAVAESPSYVAIHIPEVFRERELYFLSLVRHLYVSSETVPNDLRARELAAELPDLQAPHDSIGLAFEGLGKTVRPIIRDLYSHPQSHVSYYSARTGLHLNDKLAVAALQTHALDPESPFQLDAIRDLGESSDRFRAGRVLKMALDSDYDIETRVLAYEGLARLHDPVVTSTRIGNNFDLDRVPLSRSRGFIFAKTKDDARLAIIGDVRCKTPLFYRDPDGSLTMNATTGDRTITVQRKTPRGRVSPATSAPLEVSELVALLGHKAGEDKFNKVTGLGLSYARILGMLSALCEDGTINAQFRLQRTGTELLRSPRRRAGRPESEL